MKRNPAINKGGSAINPIFVEIFEIPSTCVSRLEQSAKIETLAGADVTEKCYNCFSKNLTANKIGENKASTTA